MKEENIKKIDYLLESLRAHMNLLIGELKAGLDDYALEQLSRAERDLKVIQRVFEEEIKEREEKEKKQK